MAKDSNEDDVNDKQDNSEDNFGLPDIEYKPLDQPGQSTQPQAETASTEPISQQRSEEGSTYTSHETTDESGLEEPKSKAPVILGVVIVLVLLIAAYLIYDFVYKPAQLEKAKKEQQAKEAAALKAKQEKEALLAKQLQERERRRLDSLANAKPVIGTIETLSGRTKRYYVVVTSDIDDDLLMDFARKLSLKGISTKIIPPYGEKKFYRLAIADHDSWASAQTNADAMKADYGSGVWVIKY